MAVGEGEGGGSAQLCTAVQCSGCYFSWRLALRLFSAPSNAPAPRSRPRPPLSPPSLPPSRRSDTNCFCYSTTVVANETNDNERVNHGGRRQRSSCGGRCCCDYAVVRLLTSFILGPWSSSCLSVVACTACSSSRRLPSWASCEISREQNRGETGAQLFIRGSSFISA